MQARIALSLPVVWHRDRWGSFVGPCTQVQGWGQVHRDMAPRIRLHAFMSMERHTRNNTVRTATTTTTSSTTTTHSNHRNHNNHNNHNNNDGHNNRNHHQNHNHNHNHNHNLVNNCIRLGRGAVRLDDRVNRLRALVLATLVSVELDGTRMFQPEQGLAEIIEVAVT